MSATPSPGFPDQARKRTALRVAGILLTLAGLVLIGTAIADFFGAFDSSSSAATYDDYTGPVPDLGLEDGGSVDDGMPDLFWLFFLGMPVLFAGAVCLQLGYVGAAARWSAGESAPVLKDTASYLTDGEGLLGVGRTVDDDRTAAGGPFCRTCGTRADAGDGFCAKCGTALG